MSMDETSFDIDRHQLAEASRRFPAARLAPSAAHPHADLSYLAASSAEFGRHAWDESGH
jgi:hypothetical protein